jgi:PAS domain S-box-containing protein
MQRVLPVPIMSKPVNALPYDLAHVALILSSHLRLVGRPLAQGHDLARVAHWLYAEAPFCVLAHSAESDPRFTYVNERTLACFEYTREELLGMPSRLSAEPERREERHALLRDVSRQGYASGYRGLRIAKSGRRFWIEDVTVWNLIDAEGRRVGQAATYLRTSPAL